MNNIDIYSEIVNDIVNRTDGKFENMNYQEKIVITQVMKKIKEEVDKYMAEQYPIIKMWASLDITDIRLNETEPDFIRFNRFDRLNIFNM